MANVSADAIVKKLDNIATAVSSVEKSNKTLQSRLDAVEKSAPAVYPGVNPQNLFYATTGPVGRDSAGYSIFKAVGFCNGFLPEEQCKEEAEVSRRLKKLYHEMGYQPHYQGKSFLVPYSTGDIPQFTPEGKTLANELHQKQMASVAKFDPSEAAWIRRKALGTTVDTSGAALLGYPTLGELIDLQRNMEVFSRAGASQVSLPANAMIDFPKLTGGATAYWVGEGAAITDSQETLGTLKLVGKKLAVLVKVNNELFRYAGAATEGMIRRDMAAQAALKADLAMLEGTGGTQIKGLTTYTQLAAGTPWTQGVDQLLAYTVTSNVIQPQDVNKMVGRLPDPVQDLPLSFIMRNDLWGALSSRRADAVTASDQAGPFVFNLTRGAGDEIPKRLNGSPVVTSSQVATNRGNGSQTYVLMGAMQDWLIGRFGVMEFLAQNTGDTPFTNDQTWLRAIQILDAGARHSASFVFADAITIS